MKLPFDFVRDLVQNFATNSVIKVYLRKKGQNYDRVCTVSTMYDKDSFTFYPHWGTGDNSMYKFTRESVKDITYDNGTITIREVVHRRSINYVIRFIEEVNRTDAVILGKLPALDLSIPLVKPE